MLTSAGISAKTALRMNHPEGNRMDPWQRLLQSVLPHLTTKRVGRLTGKSHRVAQKWHSGEMTVPPEVVEEVTRQQKILADSQLSSRLESVISDALATDLNPEIIASHLADQYRRVTGLEIE